VSAFHDDLHKIMMQLCLNKSKLAYSGHTFITPFYSQVCQCIPCSAVRHTGVYYAVTHVQADEYIHVVSLV
jgi:hypothetical protein